MRDGIDFYFGENQGSNGGFRSSEYGIINVVIDKHLQEKHFLPTAEIRETKVRGNPKPHFHGVDLQPAELNLTFYFPSFDTGFTDRDRKKALRDLSYWLTRPYYVPFGIVGQDYVYYVVPSGDSNLTHDGGIKGYIEITLRADAPWAYSEIKSFVRQGLDPNEKTIIEFENNGDLNVEPEIWIDIPFVPGGNDLECSIIKVTDDYETFKFEGLLSKEELYIHNEKKYIKSMNTNHYRYDNFNKNYLSLAKGVTELELKGIETIRMRYQERKLII